VSVAKAPGDGITGAGPAIITTGSGVGNRLTAKKAAPNRHAVHRYGVTAVTTVGRAATAP
jgi:hypothetical protein